MRISQGGMEDLDALLADLHTVTTQNHSKANGTAGGTYNHHQPQRPHSPLTNSYSSSQQQQSYKYEYKTSVGGLPEHRSYKETIVTTSARSPSPTVMSFNNNLSELDNLLEDLSNARRTPEKKPLSPTFNGPARIYNNTSPTNTLARMALTEPRPTVESLLDELQSAVPNQSPQMRRHIMINTTASSATKELDDLMASLSDFKLNPTIVQTQSTVTYDPPAYAKPSKIRTPSPTGLRPANQLDSMLGTLQNDMSKQGVTTPQKGCCAGCNKPIVGQVVTALGKTWHPEHFCCTHCKNELGNKTFFEREGRPYCEQDYHDLFSPRCAYCNGPILDKCVTALDKTWHPEHFFCAQCGNQFGEDGFHEKDGKAYCRNDYFDLYAPKCGGCNRPIAENYISALGAQWHSDCFVCRDCRLPFNGGSFFDHEGMPYCETHYHAKRGSLCAGCQKPITGRCITAMFRKFHPEHFVCSFCLKQLNKGTFKEQQDKPYCHNCFDKLFG